MPFPMLSVLTGHCFTRWSFRCDWVPFTFVCCAAGPVQHTFAATSGHLKRIDFVALDRRLLFALARRLLPPTLTLRLPVWTACPSESSWSLLLVQIITGPPFCKRPPPGCDIASLADPVRARKFAEDITRTAASTDLALKVQKEQACQAVRDAAEQNFPRSPLQPRESWMSTCTWMLVTFRRSLINVSSGTLPQGDEPCCGKVSFRLEAIRLLMLLASSATWCSSGQVFLFVMLSFESPRRLFVVASLPTAPLTSRRLSRMPRLLMPPAVPRSTSRASGGLVASSLDRSLISWMVRAMHMQTCTRKRKPFKGMSHA